VSLDNIEQRASAYASLHGMQITDRLGFRVDGTVFSTSASTAVKVHHQHEAYRREQDCYFRLLKHGVIDIHGHHVPQLIWSHDELRIIEMTIVSRPYLLDFAAAHLDSAPSFNDEIIEQWHEEK